ncbi:MAG: hypothetical protein KC478_13910 [Bacteriovoracaceae bacterium]|nr:hypothetical protein [Bacteriovoracaceae bacterium]
MSDNEDDKPTVVLDINALREEARSEQDQLDDVASDLEFAAQPTEGTRTKIRNTLAKIQPTVIMFDFHSDYFAKNHAHFPEEFKYEVVSDLKLLNGHLQQEGPKVVLFNYNAAPKAVNQLCAQIKVKFSQVKSIIIAKNLSAQKAQAHKQSKAGANGYISAPFKSETLSEEILKVLNV